MIPRRAPRTLTRRRRPWRPFLDALEAYGVDPMTVPETSLITHARKGVIVEVLALDEDGGIVILDGRGAGPEVATVRKFFPHPVRRTR